MIQLPLRLSSNAADDAGMTRSLNKDLSPTDRELRWFAHIDRHGPQSSELLYEVTRDTHRCKDTALRRLQALREAKYLHLPRQQEQVAKANFNPNVYDLTKKGREYLSYHHELEHHARSRGHWWHDFWVSCVTSAIEINAQRAGLEFIPAARILKIKDTPLAIPLKRGKLIPDAFFAIKHEDGFRTYALEVDRGTEPVRSSAARKSLVRSVSQYEEVLSGKLHQRHYGLKSNLIVLWVFNSAARQQQFRELVQSSSVHQSQLLGSSFPDFSSIQRTLSSLIA